ncbi:Carbamoyltransferase HypF [Streptomyces sp. MBT84]|nr:Carbamoyltransferase HypF [Streptomyces sp. MBT84]
MSGGPPTAVGVRVPQRRRVTVRGVVQGVGFRPYVYSLATALQLSGHVTNTPEGVVAEVEGTSEAVARFCERIAVDVPPLARVDAVEHEEMPVVGGDTGFAILASRTGGPGGTLIPPDTATCAACLSELADPADRRHRHPFVNCTHCGPRFTIVTGLPYDRAHTTMAGFPMCADCSSEYADPADRRFHAQPVACPACGPRLRLLVPPPQGDGPPLPSAETDPVAGARALLASGAVLAVKGLGGYHLACDATDPAAVARLRHRKARGTSRSRSWPGAPTTSSTSYGSAPRSVTCSPAEPAPSCCCAAARTRRSRHRGPTRSKGWLPAAPTSVSCCPTPRCTKCSSGCPATPRVPGCSS